MRRICLGLLLAVFCLIPVTGASLAAGGEGQSVLEKYARKLKWFHSEANPGEKIEVLEAALLAAKAGVTDAQLYLAYAYIEGVGVEKDREKGMELLREAAKNGSQKAREALEDMGENLDEDLKSPAPDALPAPVPDDLTP